MSQGASPEIPERPGRPPPPDPSRVQHLRTLTPLHQAKVQAGTNNQSSEDQDTFTYVHVVPETSSDKDPITLLKPPPLHPKPVTLHQFPVARPRRPILSRVATIAPEEHVYECIEDVLSEGASTKSHVRPARPPPPNPSKVQHLQRLKPLQPEEVQTYNPLPIDLDIPEYVFVLPEIPPVEAVTPAVLPTASTMWRKNVSQSTETPTPVIRASERSWDNMYGSATTAVLLYDDVLQEKIRFTDCTTPLKPRLLPAPPQSAMLPPRRPLLSQSAIVEPVEHVYEFIEDVLPENKEDEDDNEKISSLSAVQTKKGYVPYRSWSEPSSVYRSSNTWKSSPKCAKRPARPPPPDHSKVRHLQSLMPPNKADVKAETCTPLLEDQETPEYLLLMSKTSNSEDCTTPLNPSPPPPPVAPPRPAILSQPASEVPVDHENTYVTDVLTEDEEDDATDDEEEEEISRRNLPAILKKKNYHSYFSWSEQSSVCGDSNAKELELLLEWWRTVRGWERIPTDCRGEETDTNTLISTAQKVKTAMRLYELLIFQRGTGLMNDITKLHCTADNFVKSSKKVCFAKLTGGTIGAFGGVAIAAGLALAPVTLGASVLAAGVGVGVSAAGGFTGASATVTRKFRGTQYRIKVDTILQNFESQIKDIVECLKFINTGMECLRMQDHSKLRDLDDHLTNIAQAFKEIDNLCNICAISESVCSLQELDSYYYEEDRLRSKKNLDRKFAEKVHEVADKLKEEMDKLIRVKNLFQGYNAKYEISDHF